MGTARASPVPRRVRKAVSAATTAASKRAKPPCGKNGSAEAVQPAKTAASAAAPRRVASTGRASVVPRRRVACRGAAAPRSASANSDAAGLRPGASESDRSTSSSSRFGRSGRSVSSRGAPCSIARAVSSIDDCQKGCRPESASQSITPTAQTSAAAVDSSPASRSGEMYASVPGTSPCAVRVSASAICASPKSRSFACTSAPSPSRTFEGFTSRWRIPFA